MEIRRNKMSMTRGDSESFTIRLRDKESKDYILFETGDTVYFTVKDNEEETDIVLQRIVTVFDEGKAVIEIDPEDTKDLEFGDYVYDVQLTDKNGKVTTIIKPNEFILEGEVTYD